MREFAQELKKCLADQPPFCSSACPFPFDVRDFLKKCRRGSFNSAYRVFANAVAFPRIVCDICPRYCEQACIRTGVDTGVRIRALEQAAVGLATRTEPDAFPLPPKDKTVAVIGASLAGLGCALRLAARKYTVVVYEKGDALCPELSAFLPAETYLPEIRRQLKNESIDFRFRTPVTDIRDIPADAVFLATDAPVAGVGDPRVFAGIPGHPVDKLAYALRAAGAIEGYLKSGIARPPEEKTPTLLRPELFTLEPQAAVGCPPFDKQTAQAEAARCIDCRCDACVRSCDLMTYYEKYPKRIEEEVEVTIHPGTLDGNGTVATRLISTCSHCGACEHVCPQGIDVGAFLLQSHRTMTEKGAMPWVFHDFWLRDMAFSNDCAVTCIRENSRYLFFPGCRLGASDPRYTERSFSWLSEQEERTSLYTGCCGAPALWAGEHALWEENRAHILSVWEKAGRPTFVLACTTCSRLFAQYFPQIETVLLYTLMRDAELPQSEGMAVDLFHPCASIDRENVRADARALCENLGLSPAPETGIPRCCGWGGQTQIANPRYFAAVVQARTENVMLPLIVYCANCRDVFAKAGKRVYHILDLAFGLDAAGDRLCPTPSESRENRRQLSRMLTGERSDMKEAFALNIPQDVRDAMSAQMILEEDVRTVIEQCEASQQMVRDEDGAVSGMQKLGAMTFWARWTRDGGTVTLWDAYCHRMSIGDDA